VIWLRVFVVLFDVYLLASFGSWFALHFVQWRVQCSGRSYEAGRDRLYQLADVARKYASALPESARPGRFAVPDQLAEEQLIALKVIFAEAQALLPTLSPMAYTRLGLPQALLLGGVSPLIKVVGAWRDARTLWRVVDRAEASLRIISEQDALVQSIPSRTRAALNEIRAEVSRLSAVLESVQEEGIQGLEDIGQTLEEIGEQAEGALDALSDSVDASVTIYNIDKYLAAASPTLQQIDAMLGHAAEARGRAQSVLTRIYTSLDLAEERWAGLQTRGATDPDTAAQIKAVRAQSRTLPIVEKMGPLADYENVTDRALAIDSDIQRLMVSLDSLEALVRESKDALLEASVAAQNAEEACRQVGREDPGLVPDESLTLASNAREECSQAEIQREKGTRQAYEASIAHAQKAIALAQSVQDTLTALPDTVEQLCELLAIVSEGEQKAWRLRLERISDGLKEYPRHWEQELEKRAAEAAALFDTISQDLATLPAEIRAGHRMRQSQLSESLVTLAHARGAMDRAKELVGDLEQSLDRIQEQRRELEEAILDIEQHTMSALRDLRSLMLPELQQRVDKLWATFADESAVYRDPSKVDYDQAMTRWLPAMREQIAELSEEHHKSVRHYRRTERECTHRIDRLWTRLQRLDPYQLPAPAEDVQGLARELDAWRAAVSQEADNPSALRDLVGRDAKALQRRLVNVIQEIEDGRSRLGVLSREYRRLEQAAERLSALVSDTQAHSKWSAIDWGLEEAEEAWREAVSLERESQAARTLSEAVDRLQRAVNAAKRSEQLHTALESQATGGLGTLDNEMRTVIRLYERGQRIEQSLRQQNRSDRAERAAARLASAQRALETAQGAATFDDALRHLRTARRTLDEI